MKPTLLTGEELRIVLGQCHTLVSGPEGWAKLCSHCAGGKKYFLVSGNPGLGKSVWLTYFLAVVKGREKVVVQTKSSFLLFTR